MSILILSMGGAGIQPGVITVSYTTSPGTIPLGDIQVHIPSYMSAGTYEITINNGLFSIIPASNATVTDPLSTSATVGGYMIYASDAIQHTIVVNNNPLLTNLNTPIIFD